MVIIVLTHNSSRDIESGYVKIHRLELQRVLPIYMNRHHIRLFMEMAFRDQSLRQ